MDPFRNGNRWRVIAVEAETNRVAAERLTDHARVTFERDYLTEHVTLGYAVTVHSAQSVTTDTAHAIVAEGVTRAMAYVSMSRGRDTNQAYIYNLALTPPEDSSGSGDREMIRGGYRGNLTICSG